MTALLYVLKHPLQALRGSNKSRASVEETNKAAARKFRAGTRKIMSPQERQAFLKSSEYGRITGVADKPQESDFSL